MGFAQGGDKRVELRQIQRTRAWEKRTVSDIVRVVAQEYGMTARADDTAIRDDFIQARETDWEFLQRLAYESANAGGR
ncbi:MAG: hypothetical protein GWO24_15295, partial [Akkermansiaceae bacterium]|nr:hypothetical protein [Akkermansiaceae bacterium]NIS10667.1 hypothetical protein [Thermoplasmata archaeon]